MRILKFGPLDTGSLDLKICELKGQVICPPLLTQHLTCSDETNIG